MAAALACGLTATTAQATPTGVSAALLKAAAGEVSSVQPVASARCWWRNSVRHCRPADPPHVSANRAGRGNYYEQDASKLPVGSKRWWDVKEREGSAGRP
jgi:hypothetical protein